jgi:hypothetical protein
LGKFWKVWQWKTLVFMAISSILRPNGTFYVRLVHFSRFGMLYGKISGNPEVGGANFNPVA